MKKPLDRYTIYDFSNEEIVSEICRKVKALRRSCCFSQQEFAERSGVSIASVKRIEAGTIADLNIGTLIKIMRACGVLEGLADLIPEVPESPFLTDRKSGAKRKNCKSTLKTVAV
ncbi:MAG: helix-turn-helix domain-containing protein [Bacteroidales bacterium]|nr:helix-turn-helix domain-containing protein [Bacteroidales bacterium]